MNLSKLLLGILILAMLAAVAPLGAAAAEGDARAAAMLSITADEANEHVAKLADDTFEGRESGSRGGRAAGIYIVERLKSLGIKGALPKGGYYQNFGVYSNILASIEGRDPLLNQQAIVVGAHYDHVGYGNARNSLGPTGFIHNGADDNASGVAGLLEVADAIARLPRPPKRTILFAFWDGEERGLLGSKHWVDQPTVPLAQVPIVLNADMIGRMRGNRVIVYGSRSIAGLRRLVCRQNDASDLTLDFSWELKGDSDHYTFISRNIPVLMLFTGLHEDYHRPSDDVEKINKDGMERISRLIFNVVMELAEADVLGSFRHEVQQESSVATQRHADARWLRRLAGSAFAGTRRGPTREPSSSSRSGLVRPPKRADFARAIACCASRDASWPTSASCAGWSWLPKTPWRSSSSVREKRNRAS